ncbi:alpha/beta fold hydrolase [Aquicoccus sp. SCR17]|nr:alpha/beta fold hydrolase [Carideicomes alvinocaridis]
MKTRTIDTSHGTLSIAESSGTGPALLMLHGNSSCKEVFRNQLEGTVGQTWHCVAPDLPGHGASADATDPDRTYHLGGYADAMIELMTLLGHDSYAVLGWSLGGHVALEMMARSQAITGVMITGTPPVASSAEGMAAGFLPSEHMGLTGKRDFTPEEVHAYARATAGAYARFEPFMEEAVARTDGRAREMMFAKIFAGLHSDQREMAIHSPVPLAVVNGSTDAFVNPAYLTSLPYENLWEEVHLLDGVGHAPFWEEPEQFDPILLRFLSSVQAAPVA